MPRTQSQKDRAKTKTFREAVIKYARGVRKRPPRLRVTLPDWREYCEKWGVDPGEVFDDWQHMAEAQRDAQELEITVERRLQELYTRHCDRIRKQQERARVKMIRTVQKAHTFDQDSVKGGEHTQKVTAHLKRLLAEREER